MKPKGTALNSEEIAEHGLVFTISLFRSLLVSETKRITAICNLWEEKLIANAHQINEEIQVEDFAVGKTF